MHGQNDSDDLEHFLNAAADGSHLALAELYDRLCPHVYGLAMRVTTDSQLAERATTDTFLSVWRHSPRIDRSRVSARAWILELADRHAALHARAAG